MSESEQQQQFSRWLAQHKGLMLKVVRSFAFNDADRDDLFQEVATSLWKSLPGFNEESKESTWIYRVALFTATAWTRKQRKHRHDESLTQSGDAVAEKRNRDDDRLSELYELIADLPVVNRSLLLLTLEGYSHQEIADTLGLSVSNVGVRAHRIKKRLIQLSKERDHDV